MPANMRVRMLIIKSERFRHLCPKGKPNTTPICKTKRQRLPLSKAIPFGGSNG